MRLIQQIRHKKSEFHAGKDILAGIIVALVSIPISMGYAQIAGLPVVYGLYGSLLPILVFAFLSTSPQFVVGVDAMPAVMAGSLLSQLGIVAESSEAMKLVPVLSFLVAAWFLVFYVIKAGRVLRYISTPVMGGFISGVGVTIILMQIPKLFGGSAGVGEIFPLLGHLAEQLQLFQPLSAVLGIGTVVILLICKKYIPKVPMTVIMMVVGAVLQVFCHLDQYGVKLLPRVEAGLPALFLPDFRLLAEHTSQLLLQSLSIAAVIMAQTLLATGNYAMRYNDTVDNNAELLAYAAMNAAGGAVGCCPINGSVSRSGIADTFGARSQIMSVAAAATMLVVLLFGTPLLQYLPVPILTGIVIVALIGILEIPLCKRLWKTSRNEWIVFLLCFLGVLIFGTVPGVVIGCLLSFAEVAVRAVAPPTSFMGRIPGEGNFYPLDRNSAARPIEHVVIYRFSGNLFFANIDRLQQEIEGAIREDTTVVVVDARGIGSIDVTAADRLLLLHRNLQKRGIHLYLAEHDGSLNDQLRMLGAQSLIEEGAVRRTITLALQDGGIEKPYTLMDKNPMLDALPSFLPETDLALAEFEWAFGAEAERYLQQLAEETADELVKRPEILENKHLHTHWGSLSLVDENELMEHLELRLEQMSQKGIITAEQAKHLEERIEKRKAEAEKYLQEIEPHVIERLIERRHLLRMRMKERSPEEYAHMRQLQREWYLQLKERDPQLAEKLKKFYDAIE